MGYDGEANGALASVQGMSKSLMGLGRPKAAEPTHEHIVVATPSSTPAPTGAVKPGPSVISVDTEMKGSINTRNEMHVYGVVEGDIQAAALVVCKGGAVKGDVKAKTVIVQGRVEGRIFGEDVRLQAGADVNGEIHHTTLGMDPAAVFEGTIARVKQAAA